VVGALLALGADAAEVDLEAVLGALRALPAQQFKTLVQGVARTEGMLLERPASRLTSAGPVWQRLAVGDGQLGFEAKIDWRYLESVEAIVASWRAG
jgi:hypothetical protein